MNMLEHDGVATDYLLRTVSTADQGDMRNTLSTVLVIVLSLLGLAACGGGGGGAGPAATTYTVGGTVSGLASGQSLVLQNNASDNLTLSANGAFAFATTFSNHASYVVTLLTAPSGQTCSITNGSGTIAGENVTNVTLVCAASTYSIGGSVSGLAAGKS